MTAISNWKDRLCCPWEPFRKAALPLATAAMFCASAIAQGPSIHTAIPPGPATLHASLAETPSQPAETDLTQLTHIEVGHLFILHSRERVSRIYVADPTILESYVGDPRQIVVTGKTPGTTSLVLWDENGKTQTFTISVDLGLGELRVALQHALPNEKLAVEASEGKVILIGTVSTRSVADAAVKLASLFSKDVVDSMVVNSSGVAQVELKVRFIEVDRSRLDQYGINVFGPSGGTTVGSSTTTQFPSTATLSSGSSSTAGTGYTVGGNTLTVSNPLNFLFYNSKLGVGVSVQDLASKQLAQILAEPTITTLSGQSASFLAGGEFPFPVVQGSSGGTTSITIQFRPYGVKLDFMPKVNVDGTIELKVTPEVSSLDYTNAVSISGYTIPAISTKHADTQVVLRSGQSFAISGLLDKQTTDSLSQTPGLASIPLLGALFKSKGVTLSTSELIVIVTPTIVNPLAEVATPKEPAIVRPMLSPQRFDKGIPAVRATDNDGNK